MDQQMKMVAQTLAERCGHQKWARILVPQFVEEPLEPGLQLGVW